jgi:hypothetical protein
MWFPTAWSKREREKKYGLLFCEKTTIKNVRGRHSPQKIYCDLYTMVQFQVKNEGSIISKFKHSAVKVYRNVATKLPTLFNSNTRLQQIDLKCWNKLLYSAQHEYLEYNGVHIHTHLYISLMHYAAQYNDLHTHIYISHLAIDG